MFLQSKLVNAERCMMLNKIPQEIEIEKDNQDNSNLLKDRPDWPEEGNIAFKDVSLRYRPNTEIVLNKLSFNVEKGQKIGVVGRTGAGKSTISLAISRVVEIFEGSIQIDGIDI